MDQVLAALQDYRKLVLIVDGGSTDQTRAICERAGFSVIASAAGRAHQMNAGAAQVNADYYWFLHADCIPPVDCLDEISSAAIRGHGWGRFDVRLTGQRIIFRVIESLMNWRSCLTQVATGDQGIFVSRALVDSVGGFPEIPLMEDIAISKLLRRQGSGACIRSRLQVSSRRWEVRGVVRTILQMWWLRLRYFMGANPEALHRAYYG